MGGHFITRYIFYVLALSFAEIRCSRNGKVTDESGGKWSCRDFRYYLCICQDTLRRPDKTSEFCCAG